MIGASLRLSFSMNMLKCITTVQLYLALRQVTVSLEVSLKNLFWRVVFSRKLRYSNEKN